jgi:hypothetical protein
MERRNVEGPQSNTKTTRWQDRSIVQRLLLSLIDANPGPEAKASGKSRFNARERRLKDAMRVLFNESTTIKGEQAQIDSRALWWMATQHHNDLFKKKVVEAGDSGPFAKYNGSKIGGRYPSRSDRQLSLEAAKRFHGPVVKNSLSDRDRINREAERLRKKWRQQRVFWMDLIKYSDDDQETDDLHILINIWTALQAAGIETVPNSTNGTPVSLELATRMGIPKLVELVTSRQKTS